MTDAIDEETPLEVLQRAVQVFVNATADQDPGVVVAGMVLWEAASYDDTGRLFFEIDFASIGTNQSMTAAVGLIAYAKTKLLHDLIVADDDDDEE